MREGSTIGQYRLLRKIGEGGMGRVYVGEHVLIGRLAAIKILKRELCAQPEVIERFFNEARATSAIRDPGIPQLFDFGFAEDSAYIVMELLDGEALDARIRRIGVMNPVEVLRIVRQVAATLAVVHARGIVHRDLKPANLFVVAEADVTGGERVKILDFGIAKLGPDLRDGSTTRAGAVMGTPIFMSPEQCGAKPIDLRSDIYSLGCVMFALLCGRPPFDLEGAGPVIAAHLREPAPAPSSIAPHVSPAIDELVLRCLAKDPAARPPSMHHVQHDCDRILGTLSGVAVTAAALPSPTTIPSLPSEPQLVQPTTLGGAAGQTSPPLVRRIGIPTLVIASALGVAAIIAIMVARGGTDRLDPTNRAPLAPAATTPSHERAAIAPAVDAPTSAVDAQLAAVPPSEPLEHQPSHAASELPVAPPARPAPPQRPTRKPATTPAPSDLYDDRN